MQLGRLSGPAHRFLAARADAWLVERLRSVAEGTVGLLHSENHDPRTNGEHALVRRLAPRLRVVIDVGANHGDWTRYVATHAPRALVYAVEIATPTRSALRSAVDGLARVHVPDHGLGRSTGRVNVKQYPEDDRLSSVVDYPHPQRARWAAERIVRGDEFLAEHRVGHVDLLKVDAEGSDLDVLHGFSDAIAGGRVTVIQFEYGYACVLARAFLLDFYELLEQRGYAVGKLHSRGVEFRPYRLEDETFFGPNFVAVHRSDPDLISSLSRHSRGGAAARSR
jgi:FkbM family methyltransferase